MPQKARPQNVMPIDHALPGLLEGRKVNIRWQFAYNLCNIHVAIRSGQAMKRHPMLHRRKAV
jgi:hypothetical protein